MASSSAHPTCRTAEALNLPAKRTASRSQAAASAHWNDLADEREQTQPTRASKRSRTSASTASINAAAATILGPDDAAELDADGDAALAGEPDNANGNKPATEKEKEARRMARMIRNRNAAQASRDRKKEHTAFLERRVAQLETLLRQAGRPAPAAASPAFPPTASPAAAALPPLPGSRLRATSVSSNTSSAEDPGRVADLEEENDSLRSQLHAEQAENARLVTRLELVEEKLARLTTPDAGPISFSPFSGTTTPLPAYEPTFAFDTPDIKPLPQPEERAFMEERERQRRPEAAYPSPTSLSAYRLAARHSAAGSSTPSLSSGPTSTAGSVSGLELDISSAPQTPESYLDLDELELSPEWSAWAAGAGTKPADPKAGPSAAPPTDLDDDEAALAYLDLNPDTENLCFLDAVPTSP
ncbi:hypothetical protein JCM8202v2_004539 [Rhodotorula sphaerocarpa]